MEMKAYQVAEADCECFFGKLFIDNQPERLNPETPKGDVIV